MTFFNRRSWPPYVVGIGIGLLSWFTFASADHPLGVTTAFENSAVLAVEAVTGPNASLQALAGARESAAKINWEWMLVLGVFIGAFLSAQLGKDRTTEVIPDLWRKRFGPSNGKRLIAAFLGGVVMMFGARLAQGCTSGHGISGMLQLAVSSTLFVGAFVTAGLVTAKALYGKVASHV